MSRCASAWRRISRSCGDGATRKIAAADAAVTTATTAMMILERPFMPSPHIAKDVPLAIIGTQMHVAIVQQPEPPRDAPKPIGGVYWLFLVIAALFVAVVLPRLRKRRD